VGHILGYARVRTLDQSADYRIDALRAASAEHVFVDKA
jgi:DNA invertase Pin-like site-specific DNA recombinase